MQLHDAITDYLNHIRYERGLAAFTCEHYASWMRAYLRWLADNGYPEPTLTAFTVPVLRRYQYSKSKEGVRLRTIYSAFHALRGSGAFLVENGVLLEDPVPLLTLPKKDAAIRLTVTDAEVRELFAACERLPKSRQIALSRAVLSVLCYGGFTQANQQLTEKIKSVFSESDQTCGSLRIFLELKEQKTACSRKRIARLMCLTHLQATLPKRFVVTNDSHHSLCCSAPVSETQV